MPGLPVCPDASFLLRMLLDKATGPLAETLWERWHQEGRRLVAPTLLYYEVASALHRYAVHGRLSSVEAETLLDLTLRLDIELVGDGELHRRAIQLASAFSLPAAYDAPYLALAERLGAEFWSADTRLIRDVQGYLPWVHSLDEMRQ